MQREEQLTFRAVRYLRLSGEPVERDSTLSCKYLKLKSCLRRDTGCTHREKAMWIKIPWIKKINSNFKLSPKSIKLFHNLKFVPIVKSKDTKLFQQEMHAGSNYQVHRTTEIFIQINRQNTFHLKKIIFRPKKVHFSGTWQNRWTFIFWNFPWVESSLQFPMSAYSGIIIMRSVGLKYRHLICDHVASHMGNSR